MLWHPVTQKRDVIKIHFVNKVKIDIQSPGRISSLDLLDKQHGKQTNSGNRRCRIELKQKTKAGF